MVCGGVAKAPIIIGATVWVLSYPYLVAKTIFLGVRRVWWVEGEPIVRIIVLQVLLLSVCLHKACCCVEV